MKSNVQNYFESFPNSNEVHETSDGLIFHQKGDAINHAKSLEDNSVETITRDEYNSQKKSETNGGAVNKKPIAKKKSTAKSVKGDEPEDKSEGQADSETEETPEPDAESGN